MIGHNSTVTSRRRQEHPPPPKVSDITALRARNHSPSQTRSRQACLSMILANLSLLCSLTLSDRYVAQYHRDARTSRVEVGWPSLPSPSDWLWEVDAKRPAASAPGHPRLNGTPWRGSVAPLLGKHPNCAPLLRYPLFRAGVIV